MNIRPQLKATLAQLNVAVLAACSSVPERNVALDQARSRHATLQAAQQGAARTGAELAQANRSAQDDQARLAEAGHKAQADQARLAASAAQGGTMGLPLGPDPLRFVALMLAIGLFASWLGTLCWNEASQRLPPALAGQLIVFETLAAMACAFALRGQAPAPLVGVGIVLLLAGVSWALRPAAPPHPGHGGGPRGG
jgi:hypothetical protein